MLYRRFRVFENNGENGERLVNNISAFAYALKIHINELIYEQFKKKLISDELRS